MQNQAFTKSFNISGKLILKDTLQSTVLTSSVKVINKVTGDTLFRNMPDSSGFYNLKITPGLFRVLYSAGGYLPQTVDTIVVEDSPVASFNIDITLLKDTLPRNLPEPAKYEKIDLAKIPVITNIDTSILIKNMKVNDEGDKNVKDADILYFTVQVIALHRPVDISYFKYINDMKIMYNESDKFYRYTTGSFKSKEDAYKLRLSLINKGYPKQIFIKKVSKQ
jgi:hypothetical protein